MNLHELGWNAHFEKEFKKISGTGRETGAAAPGAPPAGAGALVPDQGHGGPKAGTGRDALVPARVASSNKNIYTLHWEGPDLTAEVSGRFRTFALARRDFPIVGDWVAASPIAEERKAVIHHVLPRTCLISRKNPGPTTEEQPAAANVDVVLIVSAADHDFNPRRVERYLALAWNSGAAPVIILNKVDLAEDPRELIGRLQDAAIGVPVIPVSAASGDGMEALAPYTAAGMTSVLLGSSGVGKSTIINRLLGAERQAVQEVRQDDSRGRHTTTSRELFILPGGGIVIDSPGMREVGLWDEEGLEQTFSDIEELAARCRFSDCRHAKEPGCAVRQALEESRLDPARYRSYQKLVREARYVAAQQDGRAWEERRKWGKQIAKFSRQIKKERDR